jgi:hypothetical protein
VLTLSESYGDDDEGGGIKVLVQPAWHFDGFGAEQTHPKTNILVITLMI